MKRARSIALILFLTIVGLFVVGTWNCIGRDVLLSIPDGAPEIKATLLGGPPAKEVFVRRDGTLVRWTKDDHLFVGTFARDLKGVRDVYFCRKLDRVRLYFSDAKTIDLQLPRLNSVKVAPDRAGEFVPPVLDIRDGVGSGFRDQWPTRGTFVVERDRVRGPKWKAQIPYYALDLIQSPDGSLLMVSTGHGWFAGSMNHTVVFDTANGEMVWMHHPTQRTEAYAWCRNDLVLGGYGGYFGVFDPRTGRRKWSISGHGLAEILAIQVVDNRIYSLDSEGSLMMTQIPLPAR